MNDQKHWADIYQTKAPDNVSWYQTRPDISLDLIQQTGIKLDEALIDVGAGASTLVDYLIKAHYQDITLLDIAADALEITRTRLGAASEGIQWLVGDITEVKLLPEQYAVWHDRAVFHFLTGSALQQRYIEQVRHALKPDGHMVIATFAPDGPQQCSGLNVAQYDAAGLQRAFGAGFRLINSMGETHRTPWGSDQRFTYCHLQKITG
ncbi:MAG: class I SAM-dependent methyltransferase [Chloroflexi bacterium]|nr:class I SAM-dependent methyltransferase [Chloroflexota bacterium]MCC6891545.1 class I SAM-dependent methyltransferase [Anaerolineae bacterium]